MQRRESRARRSVGRRGCGLNLGWSRPVFPSLNTNWQELATIGGKSGVARAMHSSPLQMDQLTRLPTARQMRRWLLGSGLALALLAPHNSRAEGTAAMSVGVEVRRSCVVDTAQMTSVAVSGKDVVVAGGAVELGCSGFASAHVTLSNRNAAHEALSFSEQPVLVFEESARATVKSIQGVLASTDPDRDLVFVNVIF